VIVYHGVGACAKGSDPANLFVDAARFAEQMQFLARRRTVVPLEALVEGALAGGRPAVALTFDDGFRSVLTRAAPILRQHGFPATVFVPTGSLGRRGHWYDIPGCEVEVMDADELRAVRELGVEVESHGHGHVDLEQATPAEIAADIAASIRELSGILGSPPRFLAYPWGRSSEAARRAAADAGLEAAFCIDRPDEGRFAAARVGITALDGRLAFALKTSGRYLAWRRSRLASGAYALVRPFVRRRRRRR